MRLVIDLQACQTSGSRQRGIGRYSMALLKAMLPRAHSHDVHIVLNASFAEPIAGIRRDLDGLLDMDKLHVWRGLADVAAANAEHEWSQRAAEALRNAYISSMQPDMVHVTSLFEGFGDDFVASVDDSQRFASAVTLYDLIPLINRDVYLVEPQVRRWYLEKVTSLRRARLLLAISESSRKEAIDHLGFDPARAVNISAAADPMFRRISVGHDAEQSLRTRLGLGRAFVMYTGGIDRRKNIEGLIRAYALLPDGIRRNHQLAIVCHARSEDKARLADLASRRGLASDEVIFTGFVSDDDLVLLCNLCALFVFPSWHEGFGLPALEAMACGAPVVAANTSSLPEVIGLVDALFDPRDDDAIAAVVHHALTDAAFRTALVAHGVLQASRFTWDESARRAIDAMEAAVCLRQGAPSPVSAVQARKPRMAYVSPLPPERSGIASYATELVPALAVHYEIEIINDPAAAAGFATWQGLPVRSVEWFAGNATYYDRVLYQFGNSSFHGHMFGLLRNVPGVVVLHDFYLAHIVRHIELTDEVPGAWWRALYETHGYPAAVERAGCEDSEGLVGKYPCNWQVFADADGVIVHSAFSHSLACEWYGNDVANGIRVVPHLRRRVEVVGRSEARMRRDISPNAFVVVAFGLVTVAKLVHRLIEVWCSEGWSTDSSCVLVLAGDVPDPAYAAILDAAIPEESGARQRIIRTGYLDADYYTDLLLAADVAVQLRANTRGETSGAVLDCLAYGLATIVNAHGPMAELPENAVRMLPDQFSNKDLGRALHDLRTSPQLRECLADAGRAYVGRSLAPDRIAEAYRDAIEDLVHSSPRREISRLARGVSKASRGLRVDDMQLADAARSIAEDFRVARSQRQLLVDVSELVVVDARSGIQRVVRSVLSALLAGAPTSMRVEPVYADGAGAYRYARSFTARFLGIPADLGRDLEIETGSGDVFLGLDLAAHRVPDMAGYFHLLRSRGVSVQFVLYDLLPALRPQWFPADLAKHMQRWYRAITDVADRVIAISRSVAEEYRCWLGANRLTAQCPCVAYFHLGADIESSRPSAGLDAGTRATIDAIKGPLVLMVGTVEPRKGHADALDAFEHLWASGVPASLVIVGKRGWHTEGMVERLEWHEAFGHRLHWFEGVSDEALEMLYARSSLLLSASFAEGFGLPLIEAAKRGIPLLVRDIPVFREIAGCGALYFSGDGPEGLAEAIDNALRAALAGELPDPANVKMLSWAESVQQLLDALRGGRDV